MQIDKNRLDMERVRQEMRFEPWKMLAIGFTSAAALFTLIGGCPGQGRGGADRGTAARALSPFHPHACRPGRKLRKSFERA